LWVLTITRQREYEAGSRHSKSSLHLGDPRGSRAVKVVPSQQPLCQSGIAVLLNAAGAAAGVVDPALPNELVSADACRCVRVVAPACVADLPCDSAHIVALVERGRCAWCAWAAANLALVVERDTELVWWHCVLRPAHDAVEGIRVKRLVADADALCRIDSRPLTSELNGACASALVVGGAVGGDVSEEDAGEDGDDRYCVDSVMHGLRQLCCRSGC
ncbi:hypothetical protein B0T19DRAFT_465075, partial [Cercophora scortea]